MIQQARTPSRPRIGALRHRLTLEHQTRVSDGGGGAVKTWVSVADVWAAIVSKNGTETVVAEAIAGNVTSMIHMRYRNDVAPDMRLRLDTRVFAILAVFDAGDQRRFLTCLVQERGL